MGRAYQYYFVGAVVLCLLAVGLADVFDLIDSNADGKVDRNEFGTYVGQIKKAMGPLLDIQTGGASAASLGMPMLSGSSITTGAGFVSAFVNSLIVILVTEIGDKTFFIAAVLAMRNGRLVVYLGCMCALAAMHILSSLMGFALPSLLPRTYTHYASAFLFVYFGIRLLKDASEMDNDGGPSEELQEVEESLIHKKDAEGRESEGAPSPKRGGDIENGDGKDSDTQYTKGFDVNAATIKVFTQAFTLTFLAEWGDRSQIATIALAASKDVFGVIVGGLLGHAFCTGLAVIGGRLLAARISEKTVAIVGGILFLIFAVHSFWVGP